MSNDSERESCGFSGEPARAGDECARPRRGGAARRETRASEALLARGRSSFRAPMASRSPSTASSRARRLGMCSPCRALRSPRLWRRNGARSRSRSIPPGCRSRGLSYAALDTVASAPLPVAREIVKYAGSDLLCYREAENQRLAARQAAHWDPSARRYARGFRRSLATGAQASCSSSRSSGAIEAVRRAVSHVSAPFGLAALHVVTTLTGSAILALALANGRLSPDEVWAAAHVDEDFQIEAWGEGRGGRANGGPRAASNSMRRRLCSPTCAEASAK